MTFRLTVAELERHKILALEAAFQAVWPIQFFKQLKLEIEGSYRFQIVDYLKVFIFLSLQCKGRAVHPLTPQSILMGEFHQSPANAVQEVESLIEPAYM